MESLYIDISGSFFLIRIVHECFTIEELDNLLYMMFTYRNNQNGGKVIGGP